VLLKTRLAAVAALGVVGYGVALVFVLFGAPDLAMTQFLVETLTVILFVLVFYHLPESRIVSERAARWRDAALALAAGALMTTLVLVGTPENYPSISAYFVEHSVTQGHGRNVVNVILVGCAGEQTARETVIRVPWSVISEERQPGTRITDHFNCEKARDFTHTAHDDPLHAAVAAAVLPFPAGPRPQ
jgi:multisubunit Na+/H+ antiporter MnhB subunit